MPGDQLGGRGSNPRVRSIKMRAETNKTIEVDSTDKKKTTKIPKSSRVKVLGYCWSDEKYTTDMVLIEFESRMYLVEKKFVDTF